MQAIVDSQFHFELASKFRHIVRHGPWAPQFPPGCWGARVTLSCATTLSCSILEPTMVFGVARCPDQHIGGSSFPESSAPSAQGSLHLKFQRANLQQDHFHSENLDTSKPTTTSAHDPNGATTLGVQLANHHPHTSWKVQHMYLLTATCMLPTLKEPWQHRQWPNRVCSSRLDHQAWDSALVPTIWEPSGAHKLLAKQSKACLGPQGPVWLERGEVESGPSHCQGEHSKMHMKYLTPAHSKRDAWPT